jgi:nucleoid-associated protein YgaU
VGAPISAGLAAASALGRGESLQDIALEAARGAIPGGPAGKLAFDAAVGLARGQDLSDAAVAAAREALPGGPAAKAAFDAGLAVARRQNTSPDQVSVIRDALAPDTQGIFDEAVNAASRAARRSDVPDFHHLAAADNRLARYILTTPSARKRRIRDLANDFSTTSRGAGQAVAAVLNRIGQTSAVEWADVGDLDTAEEVAHRVRVVPKGQPWPGDTVRTASGPRVVPVDRQPIRVVGQTRKPHFVPELRLSRPMILALMNAGTPHVVRRFRSLGVLPRIARDTGELTGATQWTIRNGDFPSGVAQKLTGNGGRWKEILSVNPNMSVFTDSKGQTQIKPWNVGQTFNVPPDWVGAAKPTTTPVPGGSSTPAVPGLPTTIPAVPTPMASSSGGPPFPPPSKFPAGYPGPTYTVKSGDFGSKIAEDITGNGTRWKELLPLNPGKADPKFGIAVFAGDVLKLPSSWQAPAATAPAPTPFPLPPTPSIPGLPGLPAVPPAAPPPAPPPGPTSPQVIGTMQQIALIQSMLVTFHGKHPDAGFAAGPPPFGGDVNDLSGTWTERSQYAMKAFQIWANKRTMGPLPEDGFPDAKSVGALQTQVAKDLAVAPSPPPVPASPGGGVIPPGVIPPGVLQPGQGLGGATVPTPPPAEQKSSGGSGAAIALGLLGLAAAFA